VSWPDKFEKEDYYLSPEGYIVFTKEYHLKRGYCCQSGCVNCPYRKSAGGSGSRQSGKEEKGQGGK